MELFKILKLRDPITIFSHFTTSDRKPTLIINELPSENFVSRSTKIWNTITPKLKLTDYSPKIGSTKNNLKVMLFKQQNSDDPVIWTSDNFNIEKIGNQQIQTQHQAHKPP